MRYILFLLITLIFLSCSVNKQNKRAVNRVSANIELLNEIGRKWEKLNPCYPDTVKVNKVVTVIDSSYAKENIAALNVTIEYLFGLLSNKNEELNIDSLRNAVRLEVEKNCKPKTVYIERTVTLPTDKRAENLLKDDLAKAQLEISNLKGQDSRKQIEINELKAVKKKTMWWMIGGGFGLLAIIGGLSYLLFKKKI